MASRSGPGEGREDQRRGEETGGEEGGRPGRGEGAGKRGTSPWEWILAAVSALLILGAVGFMVYEGVTAPDTPPDLEISPDTVIATGDGYLVRFVARNRGHGTAASVTVEGTLSAGGERVETAEVVLDYVPAGARRRAGLIFSRDPRTHSLEIRALGFDTP